MTKHECAVIMAFTGVAMLKGNDLDIFYEYVAKILGRPVYTHEMAMLSEEIKEAARDDFVQLCRNASDEPEVRHGRWILCEDQHGVDNDNNNYAYFCSQCHYQDVHSKFAKVNFCWHCGVKMDGGADNG